MKNLIENGDASIEKYGLLANSDKVLIALSGGPEPVVLFHVPGLQDDEYGTSLVTVHANHSSRNEGFIK